MTLEEFLKENELEQYISNFAENDITYSVLSTLSNDDLVEIGITSFGHRKKILSLVTQSNPGSNEDGNISDGQDSVNEGRIPKIPKTAEVLAKSSNIFTVLFAPMAFISLLSAPLHILFDSVGITFIMVYMIMVIALLIATKALLEAELEKNLIAILFCILGLFSFLLTMLPSYLDPRPFLHFSFFSLPGSLLFLAAYVTKRT